MQSGSKNPPWARGNVNSNMSGMNPQIMDHNAMAISQQGMMPFQQTPSVFNANLMQGQSGMGMAMGGQMPMNSMAQGQMYPGNVVAYPTPRGMNPGMYQNNQNDQSQPNTNEQRVFTGTVTKTHNDFGFVDQNVFYSTSVCAKGVIPKVNDRVLVEATYNANMPFKWNATRVQVLPKSVPNSNHNKPGGGPKTNNYNAVPPPSKKPMQNRREERPRREDRKRSRSRSPVPPRVMRSKTRSPRRDSRRKESPPRKRPAIHIPSPDRYVVQMPRGALDISQLDVPSLSHRYTNLYVPSDFFHAKVCWGEAFPPQTPFSLNSPCGYHVMSKDVENPKPNDAVLEPPDADYRFSAKVMLISLPSLETLYQKCGLTKTDEKDKRSNKSYMHPTRLIKFLVGHKDKASDNFAIGGPWSPSLDGPDPENDPTVLVKTAIRTCKALTGIDLSPCTQWYRVVEFHYWRENGDRSRLETVALFLPDVWSAQPPKDDYPHTLAAYETARDAALNRTTDAPVNAADDSTINTTELNDSTITIDEADDDDKPVPTHYSKLDMKTIKVDQLRQELRARNQSCKGLRPQLISRLSKLIKAEEETEKKGDDVMEIEDEDEKPEQKEQKVEKDKQTTEDSKNEDKDKSKTEDKEKSKTDDKDKSKSEDKDKDNKDKEKSEKELEREKREKEREEERKKEKLEKEIQAIKNNYELPSSPHIIVHPSKLAKAGKFNCNVVILSLLLDYRVTDNKEHSFELFVFAELFNEMLQRDFGFYIYKTLYTLPEKVPEIKAKETEKKDEKSEEKSDEKTEGEKDKKDGEKDKNDGEKEKRDGGKDKKDGEKDKKDGDKDRKDRDKKSDKRDDRRDSRRKDGKQDSDDERSGTPKKLGVDLPTDPFLLLSLVYFDTRRCGYINKKDLQALFMSLGLMLSRSQIRNILEKVCVKDVFNYKSLVQAIKDISSGSMQAIQDLPLDSLNAPVTSEVPPQIAELETIIATGNRNLLPKLNKQNDDSSSEGTKEISNSGMVTYNSRVIDLPATLAALERGNQQRMKLEAALTEARQVARTMRAAAAQTQAASRTSQNQLSDLQAQLTTAKSRVTSLTASSRIFHNTLKSIQSKVDAVINIKFEEDDDCVEVINGPKAEKSEKSTKKDSKADSKDSRDKKEVKEDKESKEEGKGDGKDTKEAKTDGKEVKPEKKEVKGGKKEKEEVKDNIGEANMEIDDKE